METSNPQNPTGGLDKPAGAPSGAPPSEPVIHVIPEKFYGAATKMRVVAKKEPPKPPPGPPPAPGAAPPPRPRKSKLMPVLLIVGVVLLLGGGGAAYYFLVLAKKPAQQVAVNQNVNTAPKPVCGDNKCDSSESSLTCPADCGPPKPVCGDNKCDSSEDFKGCPADCQPPEPKPGLDSDSDGVTDIEELNVYNTDPYIPDSDRDSFIDLNEILNLFDPAKPRPSMLRDNSGVTLYRNAELAFELLYPTRWTKRESSDQGTIFFTAPSGEFIQVLIEPNAEGESLMDWYLTQSPSVRSSDVQIFKTPGGYDQILSPDRFTAFVASGHRIFVISYNLGAALEIQFKATFSMMVNSLKVTGDPPVPQRAVAEEAPPAEEPAPESPPAEEPAPESPPAEEPAPESPPAEEPAPESPSSE